jgi:hypothetical protein
MTALIKVLFVPLPFCATAMGAIAPKEALLIANGKYSHFAGFAHPRPDAAKLRSALEGLGFRVRMVSDANREQMLDAIAEFERGLRNTLFRGLAPPLQVLKSQKRRQEKTSLLPSFLSNPLALAL